ncbi:hypothetical protein P3X46_013893, partial [Hevea brasiliensis]
MNESRQYGCPDSSQQLKKKNKNKRRKPKHPPPPTHNHPLSPLPIPFLSFLHLFRQPPTTTIGEELPPPW